MAAPEPISRADVEFYARANAPERDSTRLARVALAQHDALRRAQEDWPADYIEAALALITDDEPPEVPA